MFVLYSNISQHLAPEKRVGLFFPKVLTLSPNKVLTVPSSFRSICRNSPHTTLCLGILAPTERVQNCLRLGGYSAWCFYGFAERSTLKRRWIPEPGSCGIWSFHRWWKLTSCSHGKSWDPGVQDLHARPAKGASPKPAWAAAAVGGWWGCDLHSRWAAKGAGSDRRA